MAEAKNPAEADLGIVWETPPEPSTTIAGRFAAVLREHPGEWARVLHEASDEDVSRTRSALQQGNFAGGKREKGVFKCRQHKLTAKDDPVDLYDLYAVYVGHLPIDERALV